MTTDNGILFPELQQTLNPKFLKYMGQRYGNLRIVACSRQQSPAGYIRTYADCVCDCGQACTALLSDLVAENTHSCGCLKRIIHRVRHHKKRQAIFEKKFGKLVALELYALDGKGWVSCVCDCGTIHQAQTNNLTGGHVQSCGCTTSSVEDLHGKRFGSLVVLRTYRDNNHTHADCQCDCGNRCTVDTQSLKRHRTQSCGCSRLTLKALEGQRFGHLLVLRIYRKGTITYADCQCDCGTICHKSAYQIQKDKWAGTHCGCQKKGPKYPHYMLDGVEVKDCADCSEPTPLARFATHEERWDSLDGFCSACAALRASQWQQQHPDLSRANGARASARRRARKRDLPSAFTPEQEAFARSYWKQRCAICDREEGLWYTIALDHWTPLSKPDSRGTTAANMIPLCHNRKGSGDAVEQSCNTTKHAKDPIAWVTSKLGSKKANAKLHEIETFFAAARAFEEGRARIA